MRRLREIIIASIVALIAVCLFLVLGTVTAVYVIYQAIERRERNKFSTRLKKSLRITAEGIDMIANVVCRDLWNGWLITDDGYRFGVWTETISSALGKNQRKNTLTVWGRELVAILDRIDPDHCKKSINDNL